MLKFDEISLPLFERVETVFSRPFIESAAARLSKTNFQDIYHFDALIDANYIAGAPGKITASARATSVFPSGDYIRFPQNIALGQVAPALAEPIGNTNQVDRAIILATSIYLDFISLHPFYDGNGRLARLLAQRALEDCGLCAITAVPLGAVFNRYASDLIYGVLAWNRYRDLRPMWNVMRSSLTDLCDLFT